MDEIEKKVVLFLAGQYTQEQAIKELKQKGFKEQSIQEIMNLLSRAVEIAKIIKWKEDIWQKEEELEKQIDNIQKIEDLLNIDVKQLCEKAYKDIKLT